MQREIISSSVLVIKKPNKNQYLLWPMQEYTRALQAFKMHLRVIHSHKASPFNEGEDHYMCE